MMHWNEFDHVVVNDDFEQALEELLRIVRGPEAACAAVRRPGLAALVDELTRP
jgi:guanylate kinase